MQPWTSINRCDDPAYLQPELARKVREGVIPDVQGHFDPTKLQIRIFETVRSPARQRQCLASGASKTLHSRHLPDANGLSHACDLVPFIKQHGRWSPTWQTLYDRDGQSVWDLLTSAARAHGLERVWFSGPHGAYVDGPHIQLAC